MVEPEERYAPDDLCPSAAVSITGGVQPGILNRVLGYEHRESGLLARMLLAMPPRLRKRWTEIEIPPPSRTRSWRSLMDCASSRPTTMTAATRARTWYG